MDATPTQWRGWLMGLVKIFEFVKQTQQSGCKIAHAMQGRLFASRSVRNRAVR